MSVDTTWWERQDPATFLSFNWSHPSRDWARRAALRTALAHDGTLIEVGPGSGVDYARGFRASVLACDLAYVGYEPTRAFHVALSANYPESTWVHGAMADLPPKSASVVYARAVLEHQPALEPALSQLLGAALHAVVIDWYRPPAEVATCDVVGGVPCHTYRRADVLAVLAAHGVVITEQRAVDGNEVWLLTVTT